MRFCTDLNEKGNGFLNNHCAIRQKTVVDLGVICQIGSIIKLGQWFEFNKCSKALIKLLASKVNAMRM